MKEVITNEELLSLSLKYKKLEKRNRTAIIGSAVTLISVFLLGFYNVGDKVITAQRINIVEPDGKLRMVLSNKAMSPGNLQYGKEYIKGGIRSGIIFYNDEETECGGLVYDGVYDSASKEYTASGHLSFDQYNQNQVVYLSYYDENGKRQMGLNVDEWQTTPSFKEWREQVGKIYEKTSDTGEQRKLYQKLLNPFPNKKAFTKRVFLGRDDDANASLVLYDQLNRARLQLTVDSSGLPSIIFLNEQGKAVKKIKGQ